MSEPNQQSEGTVYTFNDDITQDVVIEEFEVGVDSFDVTALVEAGLISAMWEIPVTENADGTVTYDFSEWGYGTVTFPPLADGVNQDIFAGLDGYILLDHANHINHVIVRVEENGLTGDHLYTNLPVGRFEIQILVDGIDSWDEIPVTAVTTNEGDGVMIDMTEFGGGRYIVVGWSVEDVTEDTFFNPAWIDHVPVIHWTPPDADETTTLDDFHPTQDKFNFSDIEELTSFDQLSITLSDDGTSTIIDMSAVGHGTIILKGVHPDAIFGTNTLSGLPFNSHHKPL